MAAFVTYRSNAAASAAALSGVAVRARDLAPVLEDLGERMVEFSIPENFNQGGRPNAWESTRRGGVLQKDTGRLLNSIGFEVSGRALLRVGTNLIYAPQRHFGGVLRPREKKALAIPLNTGNRPRRPQHYAKLRWAPGAPGKSHGPHFKGFLVERTGKGKGAKDVYRFVLYAQVEQPARPFLLFQDSDIAYAERAIVKHISAEALR